MHSRGIMGVPGTYHGCTSEKRGTHYVNLLCMRHYSYTGYNPVIFGGKGVNTLTKDAIEAQAREDARWGLSRPLDKPSAEERALYDHAYQIEREAAFQRALEAEQDERRERGLPPL